jgi:homoserine kinase
VARRPRVRTTRTSTIPPRSPSAAPAARVPSGCARRSRWVVGSGSAVPCASAVRWPPSCTDPDRRAAVLDVATALERHADNAAATLHGGLVAATGAPAPTVTRVPLAIDPAVVVWVPDATTTSTDRSRRSLAPSVERADAVFNIGRVAMLVAACASGDVDALRAATEDRLHQPVRLAAVPGSAAALDAGLAAGAWAGWLSGSGPTVALWCDPDDAGAIAAALPAGGHTKTLRIDREGAVVVER